MKKFAILFALLLTVWIFGCGGGDEKPVVQREPTVSAITQALPVARKAPAAAEPALPALAVEPRQESSRKVSGVPPEIAGLAPTALERLRGAMDRALNQFSLERVREVRAIPGLDLPFGSELLRSELLQDYIKRRLKTGPASEGFIDAKPFVETPTKVRETFVRKVPVEVPKKVLDVVVKEIPAKAFKDEIRLADLSPEALEKLRRETDKLLDQLSWKQVDKIYDMSYSHPGKPLRDDIFWDYNMRRTARESAARKLDAKVETGTPEEWAEKSLREIMKSPEWAEVVGKSRPTPTATSAPKGKGGNKSEAWVMAKRFVKSYLKSPKTADFDDGVFGEQRSRDCVTDYQDGHYMVSGFVDSQNSFGATARAYWTISIQDKGNGNWVITDGPVVRE